MNSKPLQPVSKKPELRILLWGLTGHGKSTVGNAIVGGTPFKARQSFASVTKKCQMERKELNGQTLVVVDTPGVFRTNTDPETMGADILESIECVDPGPHVILFVVNGTKRSREVLIVLEIFDQVFQGAEAHTIVVITHVTQADDVLRQSSFKKFIDKKKHHCFVNHKQDEDNTQLTSLMQMIQDLDVKNKHGCYRNEMIGEALKEVSKYLKAKSQPEPTKAAVAELLLDGFSDILAEECPNLKRFYDFLVKTAGKLL
ncbi:GTPase IMAP family member 4-like [Mastacembelus armatus]|uniref:GTPase IMAP family member 4-like n=1 Tax=Mastacembelus armatus TaxID=205130 RepID=UPI000E45B162|nr:GTPase IMAP family member 4-like [Mastacembelus armatus]